MPLERKLVSLHVSPWSERAKWVLDHHGLAYTVVEHVPIVGERRLRRLVGPGKPRATVPVLLAGDEVLTESWDIARYADREGHAAKLIAPEHEAAIKGWVDLSDDIAFAGRALVLGATLASAPALDENAPPGVPSWLRPALRPIARAATKAFIRKYELDLSGAEVQKGGIRAALDAVRKGLGGGSYLLGSFSYADIAVATIVQGFSPVADRFVKLGPATQSAWTHPDLAAEYADLVAWRDALFEKHRRGAGTP